MGAGRRIPAARLARDPGICSVCIVAAK